MSIVGNLFLLFVAWFAASCGLHHLLTHYSERAVAQRSAAAKFLISRLGDLLLVGAMLQLLRSFGTLNFDQLLAAESAATSASTVSSGVWLLVLGAAIKTAQFPFHGWLPETMDTPTPVSALMHAGIVNAGGFLLIRMSPIVSQAPEALACLAVLGLATACFGVLVMLTQTSVKRQLAYSTIAQMGFMMLQCGLGAFSAAMLHILAHAVYKAHAFFSSGSVLSVEASTRELDASPQQKRGFSGIALLIAAALPILALTLAAQFVHVHVSISSLALPVILLFALAYWTYRVLTLGHPQAKWIATSSLIILIGFYAVTYAMVDFLVAPVSFEHSIPVATLLTTITLIAFAGVVLLQIRLSSGSQPSWLASLRVHASNGFYINALYRRVRSSYANS